uniref:PD-(D/E)XK nuclease family transposase n=1 Tax=Candidatus Kentrum sp. SD TaxID=2126332 RepID=A0A451BMZ5_9GAMM|nr:MAG: PD-(D/E)XK nuclease family transposase [Candidatus Kentron sp. SD]
MIHENGSQNKTMIKRKLISFDWALKRLLRSKANYEVLEGFLSELLDDDIRILEILEGEQSEYPPGQIQPRGCKGHKSTGRNHPHRGPVRTGIRFFHRILFATSKAITEHMAKSEPYENVIKVISVNILYFDLGQGKDYIYHGATRFRGTHYHDELRLNEKQQQFFDKEYPHEIYPEYYLLKVNQFDGIAKDTLDEWIYFLKNEEIKEGFRAKGLKKAKEILDIMNLPEKERLAYEWHVEEIRYQLSMDRSRFMDGHFEGEKRGIEKEHKSERFAFGFMFFIG